MFRLIFLTFFGKPEYDEHKVHVHESPKLMLVPLVILAVLSMIGGWQAAPALWGGEDHFEKYLAPVFADRRIPLCSLSARDEHAQHRAAVHDRRVRPRGARIFRRVVAVHQESQAARKKIAETFSAPYRLLVGKYFVDEIYEGAIVRPIVWARIKCCGTRLTNGLIDGTVNGVARLTTETGDAVRHVESGNTRSYATWMVIGAVVFTSLLLWLAVR